MTGPGDQMPAGPGGRGRLRASHADREQAIDTLKAAFVQGRLTKDELDMRVGQVLASRTYADLAGLTADIPAEVAVVQPLRATAPARGTRGGWCYRHRFALGLVACAVIPLVLFVAAVLTGNDDWGRAFIFGFLGAWLTSGCIIAAALEQKHSRRQLPQGPARGAGGQASQHPAPAARARQLPQIDRVPRHTAEAAPRRLPRRPLPGWRPPLEWQPGGRRYATGYAGR